ncbi:M48 family metallopeptidase [Desulfoscipio gibsoniae]|uniref:Zn-dependent protease with chaperone function n=1 Tax=Desulfoscipio gibsoniae DSM 7213 TaxID=767817 RepID=R4KCV5_9FIRM|nr:M48 family metallopeptidase [Desulfoscipio gibsoniae]AGL00424.1 Zn-dependent protease with chaperone function [Desulfoscipio gibsoniae DSM 7213]
MQLKLNGIWLVLIILTGVFSLLFLWFTLFPGRPSPEISQYFSARQVSQGRDYVRGMRLVFIGGFITQTVFLLWLVFGGRAVAISRWIQQFTGGGLVSYVAFFLVLWLLLRLINLPFDLFGSYYWQHRWGFSTQSLGNWWLDYFKSAGLEVVLSAVGVALLFWIIGRWSSAWWLVGAAFLSLWLVVQSYLWPVLVSPLFNRFEPTKDPAVIAMVDELSQKAQLPVDRVLVMDASQRTTKANAYFTGLGSTRRIVLYDNLLADYPADEVRAVVAHEMAHWSKGHIIQGLGLGILANFIIWGLLFIILKTTIPSPYGHYPPYTWAVIVLFMALVSFAASPVMNHFSRNMEFEADRVGVQLTGDAPAAERLQVNLATKNLSDVAPPAYIEWFSYSHPPALARIKAIQQAAK